MKYSKTVVLKDGRTCIIRNGTRQDAQGVWDNFVLTHGETEYLTTYPEEVTFTLEQEEAYLKQKHYMMICGCGFPNSKHNFEPAVAQFKQCFPSNHTIITIPESPMFNAPEAAIVTEPRLALVRQTGKQYAQTGRIDEALLSEIGSPMIPEEQYAAIVNGGIK